MRCHALDDRGGNAGPQLNGVAGRLSREQLLESIIEPGQRIAPGSGTVMVVLNDGTTLSGIFYGSDDRVLKISKGTKPDRFIPHNTHKEHIFYPSTLLARHEL